MINTEKTIHNITENYNDAERVLLEVLCSDDAEAAYEAKLALIQLYGTGQLMIHGTDAVEISGYPNIEKLKLFVADEIYDDVDVRNMVYVLYYDFIYHNFGEIPNNVEDAMEAALTAVKCSDKQTWEDKGKEVAKIILFWLYYDGEYESDNISLCNITMPSLINRDKAIDLLRYEAVMIGDYNPKYLDLREEGELDDFLEEAYSKHPENELLARNLIDRCVMNFNIEKIIEVISNANQKLAYFLAIDLLDEWEDFFDYEDSEYTPEIIEKIWIALVDKGTHAEFLLSLYQFGRAKIVNLFGEYEVVLTSLQNADKASALAGKYSIELLSAPLEIKPKM